MLDFRHKITLPEFICAGFKPTLLGHKLYLRRSFYAAFCLLLDGSSTIFAYHVIDTEDWVKTNMKLAWNHCSVFMNKHISKILASVVAVVTRRNVKYGIKMSRQ